MKSKNILFVILLSTIALSSCCKVPKFSKGYQYDIELLSIEIAYYLDKDEFAFEEDVQIYISYGHNGIQYDEIPEKFVNLPFCLFLDYGNKMITNENDYSEYNGYQLMEEVDSKSFYTEKYSYRQDGYNPKSFNHTAKFNIPFEYFESVHSATPFSPEMELIAVQMYKDENNCISMYEGRRNEIEIYFSFNEDDRKININF